MFTGIVEEVGEVVDVERSGSMMRLTVRGETIPADLAPGKSVAVNGVCLTVVEPGNGQFSVDVMRETLARSSLADVRPGAPVNLERAVRADGRLDGHLVQGHVDATATVLGRTRAHDGEDVRIALPPDLRRYVVHKGSIAVDGVSLTVSALDDVSFTVSLIPTTLALTTLGAKQVGDPVNLEVDVIAKYVEKMRSLDQGGGA